MSLRKVLVTAAALLAVGIGVTGCRDSASSGGAPSSPPGGAAELSNVQTTLDAIDSELAGDGSP